MSTFRVSIAGLLGIMAVSAAAGAICAILGIAM